MNSISLDPPPLAWRTTSRLWLWLAVAGVAAGVLYAPLLRELWRSWTERPEYGFGLFIPFISGFLVWQRCRQIEAGCAPGSRLGLAAVLAGVVLRVAGDLALANLLMGWGLVITVAGIVLATFGSTGIRVLAAPVAFLLFMLPMPEFLLQSVSQSLQLVSSQIGVALIRLTGTSVYLEGNIIDLGVMRLQVAEACSGLRYLLSLMILAFIAAYFFRGAFWQRALVFASSLPITVLMNSVRIALVGITVERYGRAAAEGLLHEMEGVVIFLGCMILLLGEMALLAVASGLPWRDAFGLSLPSPRAPDAVLRERPLPPALVQVTLVLAVLALASFVVDRPRHDEPVRESFDRFPMQLGSWRGELRPLDRATLEVLAADDVLLADFTSPAGDIANLYIQYYAHQDRGAATHSPRLCIPAGGWEIADLRSRDLPDVPFRGQPLAVNRAVVIRGEERLLVYYWFQQRGRITTNEYVTKMMILRDGLVRHRTDGAMVRLITRMPPSDALAGASAVAAEEATDARLVHLAATLVPQLSRYIPE